MACLRREELRRADIADTLGHDACTPSISSPRHQGWTPTTRLQVAPNFEPDANEIARRAEGENMETTAKYGLNQLIWVTGVGLFLAVMTGPTVGMFTSASPNGSVVEHTITNMRAAVMRHDTRAYHQFRADLVDRIGSTNVQAALGQYRTVLANLTAAGSRHDTQAEARYRLQIALMCGRETLVSGPEHCDIAIAAAQGGRP